MNSRRLRQVPTIQRRISVEGYAKQTDVREIESAVDSLRQSLTTPSHHSSAEIATVCRAGVAAAEKTLAFYAEASLVLRDIWDVTGAQFQTVPVQSIRLPKPLSERALYPSKPIGHVALCYHM